jgi:hypothetical protein
MKQLMSMLTVLLLAGVACYANGPLGGGNTNGLNGGGNSNPMVQIIGYFSIANSGLTLDSKQANGSSPGTVEVICANQYHRTTPLVVVDSTHLGFTDSFYVNDPTGQFGCTNGARVSFAFGSTPVKFISTTGDVTQNLEGHLGSYINSTIMGDSNFNVSFANNLPVTVNFGGIIKQIGGWTE